MFVCISLPCERLDKLFLCSFERRLILCRRECRRRCRGVGWVRRHPKRKSRPCRVQVAGNHIGIDARTPRIHFPSTTPRQCPLPSPRVSHPITQQLARSQTISSHYPVRRNQRRDLRRMRRWILHQTSRQRNHGTISQRKSWPFRQRTSKPEQGSLITMSRWHFFIQLSCLAV
jgi:hypothetical protein